MENILVTGASGYVGRAFVVFALAEGKRITALGRTRPQSGIDFIKCDLTDREGVERTLAGGNFTHIVHIASLPGDTGDAQQMVGVNVNGCLNLLEAARRMKVQRFVLASSISAYEWYPAISSTRRTICRWTKSTPVARRICTAQRKECRRSWLRLITINLDCRP